MKRKTIKFKKILPFFIIAIGLAVFFYPHISGYINELKQNKLMEEWQSAAPELYAETEADGEQSAADVIGKLVIDKINLTVPIIKGVTARNMSLGVVWFEDSALPGCAGNCAIAGHRMHAYGRIFNRLNEVDTGDVIIIKTKDAVYTYVVYEKLFVKADDAWVLNGTAAQKEITLITCHPLYHPTGRLIVKGRLVSE